MAGNGGVSMIGKTLSHYRVVEKIGAGGMGEVYRATDTMLNRDVALKILPEVFAKDADRMARFRREAHVLASLNHTNIAAIYGLEQEGDTHALALELVEGPTLADRIRTGAIPLEESLNIAKQIAEALEAAHDLGIIHRDLKPANVKVREDGTVKVLDFGLAKVLESEALTADLESSPTISELATRTGAFLGTAAYMSPEQVRSAKVDKRADIWAFGMVLFEMLVGQRPFYHRSLQDTLAAILRSEPDWDALPADTPLAICRLLRRCLTKDRKQRLQAIGDARFEIEEALTGSTDIDAASVAGKVEPISGWRLPLTWVLLSVIALLTALLAWYPWREEAVLQLPAKLSINLPAEAPSAPPGTMPTGADHLSLALSPDGSRLVYVAFVNGQRQLYVREMSSGEIKPIPGTEGAYSPFFSPNGEWVGFYSDEKLKKVSLSGGTPIVLADAPWGSGGSWALDDTIYFSPKGFNIAKVPAAGGGVDTVTKRHSLTFLQRISDVLPGGEAILFTDNPRGVAVHSLVSDEQRIIIESGWGAHYLPTGHLIYAQPGKLMAISFDPEKLEVTGAPFTVLEGIQTNSSNAQYTASQSGLLAYVPGEHIDKGTFVWLDRMGNKQPLGLPAGIFGGFKLSPDGKTVAVPIADEGDVDIWLYDTTRGIPTRFTFDGLSGIDPAWTPEGRKLVFASSRNGDWNIFVKQVDGSREAVQLTDDSTLWFPQTISPDGKELVLLGTSVETSSLDIFLLPLEVEESSPRGLAEPIPFLQTPFTEVFATISPDGRWIAYFSDETGRWEIYVQPMEVPGSQSDGAGRVRISTRGGEEPIWSRDGRELFYRWGSKIYVVDITLGPEFRAGAPRVLFDEPFVNLFGWSYDVSPDGKSFLLVENEDLEKASTELVVITNFFDYLRRRVPIN